MNYKYCVMSVVLGMSGVFMNNAMADCLSSVMPQKDGVLTWSDLAKYDHCLKAEKTTASRAPLTLSQDTWAAACSGGSFTDNKCFGDDPSTNANTKLVLQVTNLYAVANLSIDDTYPAGSIWIGRYPAGDYVGNTTGATSVPSLATQVACASFTEIGWSGAMTSIGYDSTSDITPFPSYPKISAPGSYLSSIQMMNNPIPIPEYYNLRTPLYIICIGRSTTNYVPAALPNNFTVDWPLYTPPVSG